MICPNCGLHVAPEQKFCRSCGASLQAITQRLPEPLNLVERERQSAIVIREKIPTADWLMLWGMIIMFVGAATGVIGKMLMHDQMVTVVGVLVSLAGIFLTVFPSLLPMRTRNSLSSPLPPELQTPSQPSKSLPEERPTEYVSSITERTTDLLKPSAATPKQRDGNP